jgi:hypothetical protein
MPAYHKMLSILRCKLYFTTYPDNAEHFILIDIMSGMLILAFQGKSNLPAPGKPQAFSFDDKTGLVFLGSVDITLNEMSDGEFDKKRQQKSLSKRDNAKDFITSTLHMSPTTNMAGICPSMCA